MRNHLKALGYGLAAGLLVAGWALAIMWRHG